MNLKKIALAVVAAAGVAVSANAATVGFSDPGPGLQTTEIAQTLNLGLFDSTLGTLTGVTLTINGAAETTISMKNNAAQAQNAQATGNVTLFFGSNNAALAGALAAVNIALSMPTGIQNIASGATFTSPLLTDNDTTGALNLLGIGGALSQAGGGLLTIGCESLSGLNLQGGGGNIEASQRTRAGCSASIVYDYRENNNVPEPATLGLLGLVLGGAGLLGRRARAA